MNWYNEIDPAAAHILSALIAEGVLPPGHVDTRSIKDVMPDDLDGYTQCHFFAGGGLWSVAARLAGWPDDRPLWTGSCPCQPFSAAGKGLGTDDPRHLWPDFHRLISARRPPTIMGEQVAGAPGYGWFDGVRADLEGEGYASRAVDFPACSVDAPHQRNRLYWIAVEHASSERRREGWAEPELRSGWPTPAGADAPIAVAQPDSGRHEGWSLFGPREGNRQDQQRAHGQSGGSDSRSGVTLGDAFGTGLEGYARHGDGPVAEADGASAASVSSDASLAVIQGQPPAGDEPDHRADAILHADADRGGRTGRAEGAERETLGRAHTERHLLRNGTYWSDAEWIVCHDGKARRAEPGIRFLVDGLPGRVDLWRVGGNAIVPEAAAEVIRAFLDVERMAA